MPSIPPKVCEHTIPMKPDAKTYRLYPMNSKHASKIQEEIKKLIKCRFIYDIEHPTWVSPIVVVPKKNGKLQVYINLIKVNAATCITTLYHSMNMC